MSSQAFISNASQSTLAAVGDGYSVPRMPTAQRLAIVFTTADVGMMVYDTTLNNLFIWNGTAWESIPASGDAGINGAVQYNDNGIVSGAANFVYNKVNQKVGIGTITPNVELDVVGSATITGALTSGTTTLVAHAAGYTGKVGIGTATPAYLVDVLAAGAATVNDSFNVARFTGANAVANDFSLVGPATSQVRLNFSHPTASGNGEVGYDHATNNLRFVTNGTQKGAFNATGAFVLAGGEITANGTGVNFPATQAASSNANTLDDYEEGTWTGTMTGGTTNPTIPVTATGRYTKIGRVVTVQISFSNVNTVGASGSIGVTGLPFACNNSASSSNGSVGFYSIATFTGSPFTSIGVNETFLSFFSNISNAAFGYVTHNAGAAGNFLTASITYTV
jgi:hypothetical protein